MFSNYLKLAARNLRKDKFYASINIVGLAMATAAFLFIIHYVRFENSYENFYKRADNIYRITLDLYKGAEYVFTDCETHPPMAPLLKKEMPEVVDYVRVENMDEIRDIKSDNKIFKINHAYAVDPSMFKVFNYDFIEGSPEGIFTAPNQAVLTASLAKRLFGNEPALGKTFLDGNELFTISGVIKDVPPNTHLKVELLLSLLTVTRRNVDLTSFHGNNNYTYVQLAPNANLAAFNRKLKDFAKAHIKNALYTAEPIKDIHLHSHKSFEPEENGDSKTVQFMMVIAVLVLLIGAVNYINLTTARASDRTKETGMRKALGSSRLSLIKQFMTETLLLNIIALSLALLLIAVLMPAYVKLIDRPVPTNIFQLPYFWYTVLGLFAFNCIISGLYPALVLSGVKPVSVTRRSFTASQGGTVLRSILVSGQFVAALVVLSASLIIFRQLSYMRHQDLGINTKQVLILPIPAGNGDGIDSIRRAQSQVFMNLVKQLPQVERVSNSGALPGVSIHEVNTSTGISQYGSDQGLEYTYYFYGIDANFLPLMDIKMAAGENFRADGSNNDQLIMNREACRMLGFKSPEDAIGKKLSLSLSNLGYTTIKGVVEDYHQQSLKGALLPMIHFYFPDRGKYFSIRLNTSDMDKTLASIGNYWQQQYPGYPFEYRFFDQLFDQQYKADQQFGRIVQIFSGFTLFITCLGILGLTAYNINKRRKEISIRKALGASVSHIVTLLSGDFIKLVLIAAVIATPLTWYVMNSWLQEYAYRIQIHWWMFAIAGMVTLCVALLTVGVQSVKAALANPVKALKSE
ncbi:ABC transporter permease [Chitinophaga arvensicola]|uniref:Putative ABC transport system permease protein n=1 Tax=Chitinophaga arvensicola TaxID=29529 RepID=A0A1I0S9T6_9BACT|nr:ABC transporter permease [Chitinophaga arvensicola]SEW52972.1 putative ABC transport system permease protein [Chitinophaga arvensicola]